MDELLITIWTDRFNAQDTQIGELTRTVRGFNGTPGLCERLARIELLMQSQSESINAIHALLTAPRPTAAEDIKGVLTIDKLAGMALGLMKPVLTAMVLWLLLTFIPQLQALLNSHAP